jgi:hypothetical protein
MAQIESMLCQGNESAESIDLLISMTKIKSEGAISAIKYHFVDGAQIQAAADTYSLEKSNLSRDIKKLNLLAVKINRYFEMNYSKMIPVNQLTDNHMVLK